MAQPEQLIVTHRIRTFAARGRSTYIEVGYWLHAEVMKRGVPTVNG